jgi:hypothetical protein
LQQKRKQNPKSKEKCDLPSFRWHDIRHIYATLLKKNEVSLKAISVSLGHASIQTTDEVYIYKEQTVLDCRPYMEAIASKILPPSCGPVLPVTDYMISEEYISELLCDIPTDCTK